LGAIGTGFLRSSCHLWSKLEGMPRLRGRRRAGVLSLRLLAALATVAASLPVAAMQHALAQSAGDEPACPEPSPTQLFVRIHGVRSAAGTVTVVLYGDNPADFLARGKRLDRRRVPARPGTVSLCLALPHPGTFALALYHDEDGDRRLTRNLVGLPTEGYGFSRDAPTTFGPPNFDDVAFTVTPGRTALDITMRY
jgi:uncharacterized protein (DUF2141 family)